MANKKFNFSILLITVCCFYCDIAVIDSEQQYSPYRSDHFIVYYDTDRITMAEMELIIHKKEFLRNHINNYLNTDHNEIIEVYITDNINSSHAGIYNRVYETYEYVSYDNGHETAHAISLRSWGRSRFSFMKEGIAVACEFHNNRTAIDMFRSDLKTALKKTPMDSIMARMKMEIIDNQFFEYTLFEYKRAGAFLHYLRSLYGIASVRKLYQSTILSKEVEQSFLTIFSRNLDSLISDFSQVF